MISENPMKHDITIKSPVSYKVNLLTMLYGMKRKRITLLAIASITLLAWKSLMSRSEIIVYMLIFVVIVFGIIPRVHYRRAKKYNIKYIEYFFNEKNFGYTTGEYTITIDKSRIRKIFFYKRYIEIVWRKSIYIFASEEDITATEKLLRASSYESLCRD